MPFRVFLGDITVLKCDAIVNFLYEDGTPSNRSNVCKAILHRLGEPGDPEYDTYLHHIDALELKPGLEPDVCAVKGLFVPKIINAVVPKKENDQLRYDGTYTRLLHVFLSVYQVAAKKGIHKIALPPLGSGTVCHYYPSDCLKAAKAAFQDMKVDLDVTFVMLYREEKFGPMMCSLMKDGARGIQEHDGSRRPIFPDYYSCKTTNERVNIYVKERYKVSSYLEDPDLKNRILVFVYDNNFSTFKSNRKKLNDPTQTISARTTWLFACALRMNLLEFNEFCNAIVPNPPMNENEKELYWSTLNWGLTDNIDTLSAAYLAVTGKKLFKNAD